MTEFPAAMLAARHIAGRDNANLGPWSRQRWADWLSVRRSPRHVRGEPLSAIAVRLTCLDDLHLHVGLMQLLPLMGAGCTPLFSLPSEEAARIFRARARREEWDGLVLVATDGEADAVLAHLPATSRLIALTRPTVLSRSLLTGIAAAGSDAFVGGDLPMDDATYVGTAEGYVEWRSKEPALSIDMADAILDVARWNPKTSLEVPGTVASEPDTDTLPRPASVPQIEANNVRVAARAGDEMLVIESNGQGRTVLARQRPDLWTQSISQLRMPGRKLSTFPQPVRVEMRGADGGSTGTDIAFHVPAHKLEPWMVAAFLNKGGGGNEMIRAFAQGIGCRIAYAENEPFTLRDIPIVWGVLRGSDRILARAQAQGLYFFYIDHSYFDRGHGNSYRITRNRYEAGAIRDCPADRVAALNVEVQPWRKSGRDIIVCPPTDFFAAAHDCAGWLDSTLARLREVTDRPVHIRTKPKPGESAVPLAQALQSAHALVTHSSNVAIEAACLGTPVFVADASAAAPVGCTDLGQIEQPVYGDREPWLAHLAYNQFTLEEISDGRAWRMLLELEERDFV
jgi:hypothetical protein